jgi:hypothetical protein
MCLPPRSTYTAGPGTSGLSDSQSALTCEIGRMTSTADVSTAETLMAPRQCPYGATMPLFDPITIATRGGALHFLVARTGPAGQTELAFHTDAAGDPPRFSRPHVLHSICDSQRPAANANEWDYGTRLAFARNLVNLAAVKMQLGGIGAGEVWSVLNEADDHFRFLVEMETRRGQDPVGVAGIGLAATRYNCAILALIQGTFQHVGAIASNALEVLASVPPSESPQESEFIRQALASL